MRGQGAGHDFDHVQRVLKMARTIQREIGGDLETIELAALLHDIGDAKFHDGVERSSEFAREILRDLDVPTDTIEHVCDIVDRISFPILVTIPLNSSFSFPILLHFFSSGS